MGVSYPTITKALKTIKEGTTQRSKEKSDIFLFVPKARVVPGVSRLIKNRYQILQSTG